MQGMSNVAVPPCPVKGNDRILEESFNEGFTVQWNLLSTYVRTLMVTQNQYLLSEVLTIRVGLCT